MTNIQVAVGCWSPEGSRVLLARRPPGKDYPGCWEFPGGKLDPWEGPQVALVREWKEELDLTVTAGVAVYLGTLTSPSGTRIELVAFRVHSVGLPVFRLRVHTEFCWVNPSSERDLTGLGSQVTPSTRPICAALDRLTKFVAI